jgi:hypothetical protein
MSVPVHGSKFVERNRTHWTPAMIRATSVFIILDIKLLSAALSSALWHLVIVNRDRLGGYVFVSRPQSLLVYFLVNSVAQLDLSRVTLQITLFPTRTNPIRITAKKNYMMPRGNGPKNIQIKRGLHRSKQHKPPLYDDHYIVSQSRQMRAPISVLHDPTTLDEQVRVTAQIFSFGKCTHQ